MVNKFEKHRHTQQIEITTYSSIINYKSSVVFFSTSIWDMLMVFLEEGGGTLCQCTMRCCEAGRAVHTLALVSRATREAE